MKKVFVFVVLACAGLYLYAWMNMNKTINTPTPAAQIPQKYTDLKPVRVIFNSADGNRLSGWYFRKTDALGTVIVVHGLSETAGGKSSMIDQVGYLNNAGYSAFLIDLRGFGESEFRPISFATQEWKDAEAAYYVLKKYPENEGKPVGFLGHSMGGAAVIIAAGRAHVGNFVIADVPFASASKFFKKQAQTRGLAFMYPFVNLAAATELGSVYTDISAERYVDKITVPLLVIGALHDAAVDPQDAQDLYDAATTPKKSFWMANTTHNTYADAPRDYEYQVITFLNSIR